MRKLWWILIGVVLVIFGAILYVRYGLYVGITYDSELGFQKVIHVEEMPKSAIGKLLTKRNDKIDFYNVTEVKYMDTNSKSSIERITTILGQEVERKTEPDAFVFDPRTVSVSEGYVNRTSETYYSFERSALYISHVKWIDEREVLVVGNEEIKKSRRLRNDSMTFSRDDEWDSIGTRTLEPSQLIKLDILNFSEVFMSDGVEFLEDVVISNKTYSVVVANQVNDTIISGSPNSDIDAIRAAIKENSMKVWIDKNTGKTVKIFTTFIYLDDTANQFSEISYYIGDFRDDEYYEAVSDLGERSSVIEGEVRETEDYWNRCGGLNDRCCEGEEEEEELDEIAAEMYSAYYKKEASCDEGLKCYKKNWDDTICLSDDELESLDCGGLGGECCDVVTEFSKIVKIGEDEDDEDWIPVTNSKAERCKSGLYCRFDDELSENLCFDTPCEEGYHMEESFCCLNGYVESGGTCCPESSPYYWESDGKCHKDSE